MGLLLAITILSSFYLTPVAMRLAWKYDAVSRPDGFRKKHSRPTPEWGGLAVNTSILLGIALSCLLIPSEVGSGSTLAALALGVIILCLIGCYDDLCDMRAGLKLVGQMLAVLPLILAGVYVQQVTILGQTIDLGWFGIPWTMAWMLLGINAFNLIDGMDGLASTLGITTAAGVAIVGLATGNLHIATVAVVLAGALGGFLLHNLPPARIYLGDCGSMVIGLVLATLVLQMTPRAGSASLVTLGAMLFLPLYDTALAIVRRWLSGRGIMAADRGHIHHRLLDRGLGSWSALGLLAAMSVSATAAGCTAILTGQEVWACVLLVVAAVTCAQLGLFGHCEWDLIKARFAQRVSRPSSASQARAAKSYPTSDAALAAANQPARGSRQIDGLPHTRSTREVGINVRLAGVPSASTATAGKKYVELLG